MRAVRIQHARWTVALLLLLSSALLAALQPATLAGAQKPGREPPVPPPWELLAASQPPDKIIGLRAFSGGTVFAQGRRGLWKSGDAGTSWEGIAQFSEDGLRAIFLDALNPADLSIMYANGRGGLSRSTDGGATWARIFESNGGIVGFARSASDPDLLYLGISDSPSRFSFLRSADGGATWNEMSSESASMCNFWRMSLLYPHPADPSRVFRAVSCPAGHAPGAPLEVSRDQGATWTNISRTDLGGTATLIVTADAHPNRLYVVVHKSDSLISLATVFRTDDEGAHWERVLDQRAQTSFDGAGGDVRFFIPAVALTSSDLPWIYVGINQIVSVGAFGTPPVVVSRISRGKTVDGLSGRSYFSWSHLEALDMGRLHDLSVSPDGQYLYAASEKGVWRLPDSATQPLP